MSRAAAKPATKPRLKPAWLPDVADPREETILLAAFDVFIERGYEGATMLEIATRARVSKLTLYAHFADKEGLFEALIAWGAGRYTLDFAAIEALAEADPKAALEAYALALTRFMTRWQSLALYRIAIGEYARRPQIARGHHARIAADRDERIGALVGRLAAAGHIETGAEADFAADLMAVLRGDLYFDALSGARPAPTKPEVERHVRRALARLYRAYAPSA